MARQARKLGDKMLKFKLKEETEETVVYEYYPEGKTSRGLVSYNKKTNECSIVTLSTEDRHKRYALKMFSKIKEYANNNKFKTEGVIAWG